MNTKKWSIWLLILSLLALILLGAVTAIIDPFFHYHKPLPSLQYPMSTDNERYLNNGIVRHFDYDAVITGTSLTENFKASQCNDLFGVNAVKVCFSGGTYSELYANLRQALGANPGTKLVIFGIDSWFLFEEEGAMRTDAEFPMYLYDDDPFNDVNYLLNKEILFRHTVGVLEHTRQGLPATDFDQYSFWGGDGYGKTGREIALANSPRREDVEPMKPMTEAQRQTLREHLVRSIQTLARENPDTQFVYFFPPYSILYFDLALREGSLDRTLEGWKLTAQLLLEEENVQLYAFYTDYDTITNLDNYRDNVHYGDHINALLLERMRRQEGLLTRDNYEAYWQEVSDYYHAYDYDLIYN